MESYIFDRIEADGDNLTLFRSPCCGCGIPRRFVIPREQINYIAVGRYINTWLLLLGVYCFLFVFANPDSFISVVLSMTGIWLICYCGFKAANSRVIVRTSSTKFYSSYCSSFDDGLVAWFKGTIDHSTQRPILEMTA